MMDIVLIDFKQMLEEKLTQASQQGPLLVVYLNNHHATLGALIQVLQLNLADILLGKASTKHTDALILEFSEHHEALKTFHQLVQEYIPENDEEQIPIQLWEHGKIEVEDILGLETVNLD